MKVVGLTRQISLEQMFYEMSAVSQNKGVPQYSNNKGQHKEVKKTKKYKEWKIKKDKVRKGKKDKE